MWNSVGQKVPFAKNISYIKESTRNCHKAALPPNAYKKRFIKTISILFHYYGLWLFMHKSEQGFTLIELAIVLVIIALLVGTVFVGQTLIRSHSYKCHDRCRGTA